MPKLRRTLNSPSHMYTNLWKEFKYLSCHQGLTCGPVWLCLLHANSARPGGVPEQTVNSAEVCTSAI